MALTEMGLAKELDKQGYELLSFSRKDDNNLEVQANKLHAVALQENDFVYIPVPVTLELQLDEHQKLKSLKPKDPHDEALSHATKFVQTLVDNGQVNGLNGQMAQNTSHKVEIDAKGQRIIKRKGFSVL